ncbi:cytochrome b5 reductase 4-like [Glandiceps talaboti]
MASSRETGTASLSVPQAQFPAINSPQRLGGSAASLQTPGRGKVALKPGRSLMDWIRLGRSGKDLTSVGGKVLQVTKEELAKHNKPDDAWMCLKGKVYNITPYFEYHPGGFDELMRGIGIDATDLFNEVHKWVNFESMLEKCFVGRLSESRPFRPASSKSYQALKPPSPVIPRPLQPPQNTDTLDGRVQIDGVENIQIDKQPPRHDWFQTSSTVTIVIYTKWKDMTGDRIVIDKVNKKFKITAFVDDYSLLLHWDLEGNISTKYEVKLSGGAGKVDIVLQKETQVKHWQKIGNPLTDHNTFQKISDRDMQYRNCTLKCKESVSHDTYLMCMELSEGSRMVVPVGYHVFVRDTINGMEVVRPFTVVIPSLSTSQIDQDILDGRVFYLMVKIYQDGVLTPLIGKLNSGDKVSVSNPDGNFQLFKLDTCQRLLLLAAGTGFTPMVRLIHYSLQINNINRKVTLLFFNKTEKDILWREQLEQLKEDERFGCTYILSEPSSEWKGATGRIRRELLDTFLPKPSDDLKTLVCVCGPTPFTKNALRQLTDFGYKEEDVHAFLA